MRQLGAPSASQRRQRRRVEGAESREHRVGEERVWHARLHWVGATVRDGEAHLRRVLCDRRRQAGFPDASLADEKDRSATPSGRTLECGRKLRQLFAAADERGGGEAGGGGGAE